MTTAKKVNATIIILSIVFSAWGQSTQYELHTDTTPILSMPVSIELDTDFNFDQGIPALYQIENNKKTAVPCQVENGQQAKVWFIPKNSIGKHQTIRYELSLEQAPKTVNTFSASVNQTEIALAYKDQPILSYYFATCGPPEGVDPLFQRSGFIHPLYSPAGVVLSRIQPPDHYHHYGIWNPWTKTHVEGNEVDFWNLAKGQGTVRFAGILSRISGPVYSGFKVHQEHVVLKPKEKVAMNEILEVRTFGTYVNDKPVWVIDYITTLNNALDDVIELVNYRYGGGLGFRATELWNNKNCKVLTSEGKTRKDADGTGARWCDVSGAGQSDGTRCGILFLSHPANRAHPEPMRVWPEDAAGGTGEMFFEFCPIRHQSWNIEPGHDYVLQYRMVVYDGNLTPKTAETLWKNYAKPAVLTEKDF